MKTQNAMACSYHLKVTSTQNKEVSCGKHLCQSLFFNTVAGLRPMACFFIKETVAQVVFSCGFCEISKSTFFDRTPLVAASV